jgi:hypothetical protein
MIRDQVWFVCDKLGINGKRRDAVQAVICRAVSSYAAEVMYGRPKGTVARDANRVRYEWDVIVDSHEYVGKLIGNSK